MADADDLAMLKAAREQIKRGKITGITFWSTAEGWQASARRPDASWSVAIGADPFTALFEAISPTVFREAQAKVGLNELAADIFKDLLG